MARIRPERLVVCRPWTFVSLDFAGPLKVKGVVNSRARIKCWIIVYVCCSTKAVCLLPTYGYSTQSFLVRHEEFLARKVLKKSLEHALHPGVMLDYGELITLLARISYSINQRPLGLSHTSQSSMQEDNLMPLTPNMMLLGRSSNESSPLEYDEDEKFCARLNYVATVESEWWKKWVKEVLPTLLNGRKNRRI